jgi:hypothetical protein
METITSKARKRIIHPAGQPGSRRTIFETDLDPKALVLADAFEQYAALALFILAEWKLSEGRVQDKL